MTESGKLWGQDVLETVGILPKKWMINTKG
jgi:hypothetical protein